MKNLGYKKIKRKRIEKIRVSLHNDRTFFKENIDCYISELQIKVNEIIDLLTVQPIRKENKEGKKL